VCRTFAELNTVSDKPKRQNQALFTPIHVAHAYVKFTDTTRTITNTTEQSPSPEVGSHSAGVTFSASLWSINARQRAHMQYGPSSHSHRISLQSTLTPSCVSDCRNLT
jgi:hypothetical protein